MLGVLGAADRSDAGKLFTGQFGADNSWKVYEAIDNVLTWEDAFSYAQKAPDPTGGNAVGHLVVIGSAAENAFVNASAPGDRWIGLTDRVGVAPGASESAWFAPPGNQTNGWAWVNGEPFVYQNWNPGEPNDAGFAEDAGQMVSNGGWNDNASGFDQDSPVPDLDSFAEGQATFGYVIEWDANFAAQPTLPASRVNPAALDRVFPTPLARLPGPNGTAEGFGVREVRDAGPVKNARQAVERIASGAGTLVDGSAPVIDLLDPETNGGTGEVVGTELPFISNTPSAEDNDIQTVIKGTFVVPAGQGGLYTFNAHSDDGFAMRILSQATPSSPLVQHRFINVRNGYVDEDGSLVYLYPTGDSNTQGLINLAPGSYDVEFTAFENGGGAYWELSTAKGDFVNPPANVIPQYLLLGDPSSKPSSGSVQPVRMTGNATVQNYSANTETIAATITNSRTATPAATGTFADVVLTDGATPASICCGRPGANLPASQVHQFPFSTGDDPPSFSTFVTGSFNVLAIDTDGLPGETLTFALMSDDSSALRIVGQDFLAAAPETADNGPTLGDPEANGDTYLIAGFESTGNANTFGTIRLQEGATYEFEAWHRQGGGDAGMEIWVAAGDYLATGFDPQAFYPLSSLTLPGNLLAANTGLALVAGPGTGPDASFVAGDFDGDGDVDGHDMLLWQRDPSVGSLDDWKANFGFSATAAAVPEPGSLGWTLASVGLIAAFTRRRSRA